MKEAESAYHRAGVNIDAQDEALAEIKELVASTRTSGVLSELGSFGGLFRPDFGSMQEPVLVSSADGVGTKLTVARLAGDFSTVGRDLVNHCVNDILVQGARPLFFLDYVGAGALDPVSVADLVRGVAAGCRENGCALLGGETAEMPGFYALGDYELVGFIVGMVDRSQLLDGSRVQPGDLLLGLPSAGLHTNGYSLARRVFLDDLGLKVDQPVAQISGQPRLHDVLLAPHISYLKALEPWLSHPGLHAMAHITGGGLTDNLPRILPYGTRAVVDLASWEAPDVFRVIERIGRVDRHEMLRVFNMGIGMVLAISPEHREELCSGLAAREEVFHVIGRIEDGGSGVSYEEG